MDVSTVLLFLYEIAYLLGVFLLLLFYTIWRGRQATINLIMGLYLALLITIVFPNYDKIFGTIESLADAAVQIGFFGVITLLTTALFYRIMPEPFRERPYESLGKKILLAAAATILIMIFSFQVLPVTDFMAPGTPVQTLFAPEQYFFWWLLIPLAILFLI